MSFNEKNAWACLLIVLAVYIPYFGVVFRNPVGSIIWFIVAVIFLAILLSVYHAINGMLSSSRTTTASHSTRDERDERYNLIATAISAAALSVVVVAWCINAMLQLPWKGFQNAATSAGAGLDGFTISTFDAMWWVQLLFAGFVFANVVYYASTIALYRRAV